MSTTECNLEGKLAWVQLGPDRRKWVGYRQVKIVKVSRDRDGNVKRLSAKAYNPSTDRFDGRLFSLDSKEWTGEGLGVVFRRKIKEIN